VKALKHLNKYFYKYRLRFISGIVIVVLSNLFSVLPAPIVRRAVDAVVEKTQEYMQYKHTPAEGAFLHNFTQLMLWYVGLIVLVALLRGAFLYLQRQILIGMSRYIEFDLKNELYEHYQRLPLEFYRKHNTGDLMARISEDVSQVRMYLGPALMYGLNLISLFLIIIPFMFSVNTKLTFYVLLPLPLLSISIYFVNSMIHKRSTEIQKGLSSLSTFVQEAFSGIRVIKSFGREKDSAERLAVESNNYRTKSLRLVKVDSFFFPLILLLTGLSTILIIFIGGNEVIKGEITYGVIAEFIMYINMLTWPFASLGWITSLVQRAAVSQTRINEFLRTGTSITSEDNISANIKGGVTFKHVSFSYPDSGIKALKDISFHVEAGEALAILGTTGSGKSSVANMISRLYDPLHGDVLIDNLNIKKYNIESIRSQIGYVPQDVFLFSDSIKNNIAFGTDQMDEGRIIQAAKDADLYDNICSFPQGFDTVLGERGITLSGGQKQRLTIARAIVKNPKILILDDSLSAVDTHTENTILNNLRGIMKGKTTFIITHRVSSAKLAEKIIVLKDGQIVQAGNHDTLLEEEGLYRKMYQKQMDESE